MKKYYIMIGGLLIFLFAGCTQKQTKYSEQEGISSVTYSNYCITDLGVLYKNYEEQRVDFFDYSSRKFYPLCAKPNCIHDTLDCTAVALDGKASFFSQSEEYWYYGRTSEGKVDIYRTDIDGLNEKKVGTISFGKEEMGAFFYEAVIARAGKIYIALYEDERDDSYKWIGTSSCIIEYDLKSGQKRILKEAIKSMRPSYGVLGFWEENLIYTQWQGEKQTLHKMNLKENTDECIVEDAVVTAFLMEKNIIYCVQNGNEYQVNRLDLDKKDVQKIGEGFLLECFWDEEIHMITIVDEVKNQTLSYQVEGQKRRLIRENSSENRFVPYARQEDILVGHYGETGTAWMNKQDYLDGKNNWNVMMPTQ